MGIDLGMTVSKAGIFGADGNTEAVYSEEYRAESMDRPGGQTRRISGGL